MPWELPQQGARSFQFAHVGASVSGVIIDVGEQQQTDFESGLPAVWPDGKPKMMTVCTLQTELHEDQDDDGIRAVYLKGSAKPETQSTMAAFLGAMRRAGLSKTIPDNTRLTLTYVGDGPKARGIAPKLYSAVIEPGGIPAPSADTMPPPTVQQATPAPAAPQAAPAASPPNGSGDVPGLIGWLRSPDGSLKPLDSTTLAAFASAGVDPKTLPGFVPAP